TSPTTPQGMWTVTQKIGNIDPTFDACKLMEAAGATFVARESVTKPKKLEKIMKQALEHKGFSYVDALTNCHINLGRKNKMVAAMDTLDWIDSITTPKKKWDALPEEEKMNKLPTGVIYHDDTQLEYCDAYKMVQDAHQGKRGKITQDDFEKKI
ncbi:MAG TPA: 2-oxoglutarate ferredoxin oxidoreductase subunit beta, partial [Epsilonproteobacteria bacterium]|nr:2-oxoglutarate ferredoxin oxidoreductase subunit beta [Campylobacterota bacterium]